MSPFVLSNCVKALPAVNYLLIFTVGLLLFVSFVCCRSIASHSQVKRDHLSSKPSKTSRFSAILDEMYNYFRHQRGAMTQLNTAKNSVEQLYDVFLVLDVEATCLEGGEWS